jgi:hypothetical protein
MLKILKNNKYRKIIIIILALIVSISFSLKLDIVNNNDIKEIKDNTNYFVKILLKFNYSLDKDIFKSLLLFFLTAMLLNKTILVENSKQGKKIWKVLLSLIFSFFMVFGYSYYKINSWDMIFKNTFQLFKATIVFIGYYILFRAIINYIFDILIPKIQKTEVKESTNKVYNFIFVKHSFIMPLIIILICWLPYIIIYYPGNLWQDPTNQLRQFFGVDLPESAAANSTNLIDENMKITNHHPVLHTVILGMCAKIGIVLGNANIGIFIYTLLQFSLTAFTFSYSINYMKKLNIPKWFRIVFLSIFALVPIIPMLAIRIAKDQVFLCLIILYTIKIYDLIRNSNKQRLKVSNCIGIVILSLLICLFRNNGIYTIILSLPFIAVIDKMNRKKIILSVVIIIVIYESIMSILLPILKIPQTGIRESLSVPFQQTARYVKEHGNEVTENEKQVIDNILNYDTLAERYDPLLSDPVKGEFNKDATTQDLIEYFKVWFAQFLKHPTTYIQATMNNVYGYFYPETNIRHYFTYATNNYEGINQIEGFNYKYIEIFKGERSVIDLISKTIQKLPGVSWIINIALNTWLIIILFIYLIYSKNSKYIIYLMPFISIILMCILSPVNAAFRYASAYIFGMPLTIAIFVDIIKNEKNKILLEKGKNSNEI